MIDLNNHWVIPGTGRRHILLLRGVGQVAEIFHRRPAEWTFRLRIPPHLDVRGGAYPDRDSAVKAALGLWLEWDLTERNLEDKDIDDFPF